VSKLEFVSPEELFRLTAETTAYTVEGLLPSRGLSLFTAKPKQGKSCMLRQLAVAVARGQPFLGRSVQQGTVLYLSLEEKDCEVQAHLKQLGWTAEDPIYTRFGALERREALAGLQEAIQHYADVRLVIVDPLFRFVGSVRDSNDYIQVSNALEPMLELARNFNVHVAVAHHAKKRSCEDMRDSILGSQALAGGADTLVYLRSGRGSTRLIATTQRYGFDLPETELVWDAETRSVCLGETMDGIRQESAEDIRERIENDMLDFVRENPDSTQKEIIDAVHGNGTTRHEVFKRIVESKFFVCSGSGVKGSPFRYSVPALPYMTESAALVAA
jgi:RecA-family ATPase